VGGTSIWELEHQPFAHKKLVPATYPLAPKVPALSVIQGELSISGIRFSSLRQNHEDFKNDYKEIDA
jgi:hypothetical protein